jgi:hypothetical protein
VNLYHIATFSRSTGKEEEDITATAISEFICGATGALPFFEDRSGSGQSAKEQGEKSDLHCDRVRSYCFAVE